MLVRNDWHMPLHSSIPALFFSTYPKCKKGNPKDFVLGKKSNIWEKNIEIRQPVKRTIRPRRRFATSHDSPVGEERRTQRRCTVYSVMMLRRCGSTWRLPSEENCLNVFRACRTPSVTSFHPKTELYEQGASWRLIHGTALFHLRHVSLCLEITYSDTCHKSQKCHIQ